MRINSKLTLVTLGSQLMMVCAIVIYALIAKFTNTLQAEYQSFQEVALASEVLQAETNKFATLPMEDQIVRFQEAVASYKAALQQVAGLKALPTISEKLKGAVESVGKLGVISEASFTTMNKKVNEIVTDLEPLGLANASADLQTVIDRSYNGEYPGRLRILTQFHLRSFLQQIQNENDVLVMTSSIIKENSELVTQEIELYERRSFTLVLVLLGAVFLSVIIGSNRIASGIAKGMRSLSAAVEIMSTGDLTRSIGMKRKDEIGKLGADLDLLLGRFNLSIRQIRDASVRNRTLRHDVVSVATEARNVAEGIAANSDSIRGNMARMDSMIAQAGRGSADAAGAIGGFTERMKRQNSNVNDTVAAVTQMLASIDSIEDIAERNRMAAESLAGESDQSKEVLEGVFEKVSDITESVSAIQEMAEVIAGIASQTNILSMNAAIEAAHAGEFGKGFAVVADEISKLAAASAENSDEIAKTIQAIVTRIDEAGNSRDRAIKTFGVITERIHSVSDSMVEIHANMNEMQTGSKQILQSMTDMRSSSNEITEESTRIENSARAVRETMDELGQLSHLVSANVEEISGGIQTIAENARGVSGHAEQMAEIGGNLDSAVAAFTIADDPAELDAPSGGL